MGELRDRMLKEMELRNFSPRTVESYIGAVHGLSKYYMRSPARISNVEINDYLHYLIKEKQLAWSSVNVAINGIRFFLINILNRSSQQLSIPPRKRESYLPEIYSFEELERLFCSSDSIKKRILLMTTYAAGLRVSEVVNLKVKDLDSDRGTIRVEQAKGRKDRYTLFSVRLAEELRKYWKVHRPAHWLFPSKRSGKQMHTGSAQHIFYEAKNKACLTKGKGIHTLRHCFATHLLEAGYDLRTIQQLMGHTSINTTMVYLQVTRKRVESLKSPFDLLDLTKNPITHKQR